METSQSSLMDVLKEGHFKSQMKVIRNRKVENENLENSLKYLDSILCVANSPIKEIVEMGVIPDLIFWLESTNHGVQISSCSCLSSICKVDGFVKQVIEDSQDPVLIVSKWLEGPPKFSVDHVYLGLKLLVNISGEDNFCRVHVIDSPCGILQSMLNLLKNEKLNEKVIDIMTFLFQNLCGYNDDNIEGRIEKIKDLLLILYRLLEKLKDEKNVSVALYGLHSLTKWSSSGIHVLVSTNNGDLSRKVIGLSLHPNSDIAKPSVRIIGNISAGEDKYTYPVIKYGGISVLKKLIDHHDNVICRNAVWALSNILAGSNSQIQCVVDEGIFPVLIRKFCKGGFTPFLYRDIVWCIVNLLQCGSKENTKEVLNAGITRVLYSSISGDRDSSESTILKALEGLLEVLVYGGGTSFSKNTFVEETENIPGVLDSLEKLIDHQNRRINRAVLRIKEFFLVEEEV